MKRTTSLFRYTLMRTAAALLLFELLVGVLAYILLMSPVLDKLAQNFAQQIVLPAQGNGITHTRIQPADGGHSWLPFNHLLEQHLVRFTGKTVQVHFVAKSASRYWVKLGADEYVVFEHQTIVGARPIRTLLAWLGFAFVAALLISGVLAVGISQPIMQLRRSLQPQSTSANPPVSLGITELDALRMTFSSLTEKLELARDDRTTLLLGLSHELSAPVTRLTMALELYANAVPEARRTAMQADTDALRRIIEQFLSAAKCLGEQPHAQGSLRSLINWLEQHYADQPRVIIHTGSPETVSTFNTMAAERILINLIDNALRHTQGSQVRVDACADPEWLTLTVSDDGPGLSDTEIVQVFQPFNKKRSSQGLGLGLALVRLLADQNNWALTLQNRQPNGIAASIKIPFSQA